jgi:hypothetical protein
MSSTKNTKVQRIAIGTKQTIPNNITPGGQTMSTSGKWLTGASTSFLTTLAPGAWIFKASANELRKVVQVVDDTTAELESGFTVDIAPATPYNYIPLTFVKEISCVGGPGGLYSIDGVVMFAGTAVSWGKTSGMKDTASNGWVDPIVIDATGADVIVQTLLYY